MSAISSPSLLSQEVIKDLRNRARYVPMEISFLNKKFKINDNLSFLSSYQAIFEKEIYLFKTEKHAPFILDCGAHVGLSVVFFKRLYPNARVFAFEPVPEIFECLKYNISQMGYTNVQLFNNAIWNEESIVPFINKGADEGRMAQGESSQENSIQVKTVKLGRFIRSEIDFLKIDIEGAEFNVLQDIADKLHMVKNMYVEYHSFAEKPQILHDLLSIIHTAGFRVYITAVNDLAKKPFCSISTYSGMDLQLNLFCYRHNEMVSI